MIFFFNFIYSVKYKIQLADTDRFISGAIKPDAKLHLVEFKEGITFTFRSDSIIADKIYATVDEHVDLAFCVKRDLNVVFLCNFIRSNDSLFTFVPLNFFQKIFWILNEGQCMTWNRKEIKFEMKECVKTNKNQMFNVVYLEDDIYNLTKNIDLASYYSKRNEKAIEKVFQSHDMENEGEKLIANIFNIIDNIDVCFDKAGVCQFSYDYVKNIYNGKGYKGFAESSYYYST